jgi:hypothetical protein
MNATAALKTSSRAPAKEDDGLGPFSGLDFSDEKVRLEIMSKMVSQFNKTEPTSWTFSSCCGSRVFRGTRMHGIQKTCPKTGRSLTEFVPVDGTYESAAAVFDQMFTQEFFDAYFKGAGVGTYHHTYDPRQYLAHYGEKVAQEYAARKREETIQGYVVKNKVNIIFAWELSAEEAIKKWYTNEDFSKHAKGVDFDDPVDGKACLIWRDAP